jgi:hypothetical protein
MFIDLHGEAAPSVSARWSLAWRALCDAALERVRTYRRRRRERQELIDYMASDHRVAADLGITGDIARDWTSRPFWHA